MTERENKFYDVPEWPVVNELCSFDPRQMSDEDLCELADKIGDLIPEAIAAIEMQNNKIAKCEFAIDRLQNGETVPYTIDKNDALDVTPDERVILIREAQIKNHFACMHMRARLNKLIGTHGAIRAQMSLDPVFVVKVGNDD